MKKLGIPNILSIFRLLLLPVFVICYVMLPPQYRFVCAIILIISGITDVADGFIARKFKMESELGKILDPLADKLTLFTVALTLAIMGYKWLYLLAGVLFCKEICMLLGGVMFAKRYNDNKVAPSKWYGKVATGILYVTMFCMMMIKMPSQIEIILAIIMCIAAIFAFVMYARVFVKTKNSDRK